MNSYNNHILPYIGGIPLKDVRPVHIQSVMNEAAHYSEDLQRKILNTMRQIFETAMLNNLVAKNPVNGIKITPHAKDDKIKFLTKDQQEELFN